MSKILLNSGPSRRGWHRLEMFLRCPQAYAYRYILRLPEPPRMALVRGSLVHVGLAHHYARIMAAQNGADPEKYYTPDEAIDQVALTLGDLGEELRLVAKHAVGYYRERYAVEDVRVLGVEQEVEAQIQHAGRGPFLFTARADLIYESSDGRVWIEDHKALGKLEAKVPRRYTLSGQFQGLRHFGHAIYGDRFAGVRLNLIQVPHIDCAFGETRVTGARVERIALEPAPHHCSRFPQMVCDAEEQIAKLEAEITAGMRTGWEMPSAAQEQVCQGPYGVCDWFERCQWGDAA